MKNNNIRKNMLVFAHGGEAQEFIRRMGFKPMAFIFDGVYQNNENFLIITGEGFLNATKKLSSFLTLYYNHITRALNFGIAGDLINDYRLDEVCEIRTVYQELNGDVGFQSFSSKNQESTIDCITTLNRVQDKDIASRLGNFAALVDRELFYIASVCKLFGISFEAFKLISDRVDNNDYCAQIQKRAPQISALLYQHFLSLNIYIDKNTAKKALPIPQGFYATKSQRQLISSLLKKLRIKDGLPQARIVEQANIQDILQKKIGPKEKTKALIENLRTLLNPFNSKVKNKLNQLVKPIESVAGKVAFSQNYEDKTLSLTLKVKNNAHWNQIKKAINAFPYKEISSILDGNL